jgi:hypothetical protein
MAGGPKTLQLRAVLAVTNNTPPLPLRFRGIYRQRMGHTERLHAQGKKTRPLASKSA